MDRPKLSVSFSGGKKNKLSADRIEERAGRKLALFNEWHTKQSVTHE